MRGRGLIWNLKTVHQQSWWKKKGIRTFLLRVFEGLQIFRGAWRPSLEFTYSCPNIGLKTLSGCGKGLSWEQYGVEIQRRCFSSTKEKLMIMFLKSRKLGVNSLIKSKCYTGGFGVANLSVLATETNTSTTHCIWLYGSLFFKQLVGPIFKLAQWVTWVCNTGADTQLDVC